MCNLWLELIEVAIQAGLDYIIIDTEHQSRDGELLADACRLGRLANLAVLIRPHRTATESIGQTLDLGPCGLLLPMVESARQLDRVRDGLFLPPRGNRRPGGPGNRWVNAFDYATFKSQVEDHLIVLPQIESPKGLENAREIAEHEITTALAVGPFDLSARLGICGDTGHARQREALATIRRAAEQAGKPPWMIGNGEELAREGYRFLCIAEPTYLLETTLRNLVEQVRDAAADETTKSEATGK
jgi:2-keto-3-deoxy-L-rhamnonate aldolase RhmA